MKPHTHEKYIKAWAEGHVVQFRTPGEAWVDVGSYPCWLDNAEYRIKPAEKVVRWLWAYKSKSVEGWGEHFAFLTEDEAEEFFGKNLKTDYRKLNWSKQEFDE